ncbi:hypothetical protein [Paramaledivibacter caminithermalis]|uniref:hypothetical protein n=1 Tax=Paramaledivibacter caminithermalis TaxID=191027 RepID=UPI00093517BE|nr:hypothetical protein [Paramaledivibacter caminithermalis]
MEKLIRKVNAEQFNSFYYFSWGYFFYFYFSAGYLLCNKIWKILSNEIKGRRLLLSSMKI